MRTYPLISALLLAILLPGAALAGWDEGRTAYDRKDWATAARELAEPASRGHPGAQARQGRLLLDGLGTPRDEAEAIRLLTAAAEAGEPLGQLWLATAHMLGRGVAKDPARALAWLGRAAEQGAPEALHNLGELYLSGVGVTKDEAKAIGYYRRAAERGFIASVDVLARVYWSGRGVAADRRLAVEYARRAAAAGRPHSQNILGLALWSGDGVPEDKVQGVDWWRRAAEQGHTRGQLNLSRAYGAGRGVPRSLSESYYWAFLAVEGANAGEKPELERERDQAAQRLSPEEAAAVRGRAVQWRPRAANGVAAAQLPPLPALPDPSAPSAPAAPGRRMVNTGSGIVVSRDGLVLTNAHVVKRCRNIRVHPGEGAPQAASVVGRDDANDLALLKASFRPGEVARFREDRPMRSGDEVVVVGFPLSSILSREANVTAGVISALAGIRGDKRHYQLTAPVQPGNSGGPVVDMSGNVVGIVTSILTDFKSGEKMIIPQNVNFAIKSDMARKFLSDNGTSVDAARSSAHLSAADVGEQVKRVTVFVECEG